jgi:hypothetical protein
MPISPQITITPEDLDYKSFDITAVSYTSSTATYTATGHTFASGTIVSVTGVVPDGYNGSFTITSVATNTFTVANTTNAAVTTATGNAYWADNTEYSYETNDYAYQTDSADVTDLVNNNAQVAAAYAAGTQAQADAAVALSNANTALANAATAYTAALGSLQPSANTIVNASNQITAIASNGITVYSGSSSTSGSRVVMNSTGLAAYDSSNNATFSLTASTGAAVFKGNITTGATITGGTMNIAGKVIIDSAGLLTATDATFAGTITSSSATITGLLTINNAVVTGKAYISQGYLGAAATGWNFSSSGYITNNDLTTIFYPTGAANAYTLITNRPIATKGIQCDGDIGTTGSAIISSNGTNGNRNYFSYYNTISLQSISGGYGIDSDWAPNSDNTYNLGQATSAGYGANRRWQRLYSNNTTISTSDVRLKKDVSDSPLGLDFINAIRPVNYRWITGRQEVVKDSEGNGIVVGETAEGKPIFEMQAIPGQRLHYGFIAQEVKAVLDASGVEDFAGWVQDDVSDPDSTQSLSYEQFIAPLVKAVQQLSARVQTLEGN